MRSFIGLWSLIFIVAGCSSGTVGAPDSDDDCIDSFLAVATTEDGPRLPVEPEEAWASFQDTDEWEGETPVCWVSYSGEALCTGFMFDIEGRWADPRWLESGPSQPFSCPNDGVGKSFSAG